MKCKKCGKNHRTKKGLFLCYREIIALYQHYIVADERIPTDLEFKYREYVKTDLEIPD